MFGSGGQVNLFKPNLDNSQIMNSTATTQHEQIRTHLMAGKSITPGHALLVYGISRLAVAVEKLRRAGLEIDMILKLDEAGKKYGEYRLRGCIKSGSRVQVRKGHGYGLPWWVLKTASSKVAGLVNDVAYVQFESKRGVTETICLNVKELSLVS